MSFNVIWYHKVNSLKNLNGIFIVYAITVGPISLFADLYPAPLLSQVINPYTVVHVNGSCLYVL